MAMQRLWDDVSCDISGIVVSTSVHGQDSSERIGHAVRRGVEVDSGEG